MPGRRARRERRLRERGRPAWATVTRVEGAGDGRWRLRVQVQPGEGEPFDADAQLATGDPREPPVGAILEVLHLGRAGTVLAIGEPRRPAAPDPGPTPSPPPAGPGMVLGALARGLADGSLAQGLPILVTNDGAPGEPAPAGRDAALTDLSLDEPAQRARHDPGAAIREASHRTAAGESAAAD